jgi:excinuclease ABC subunit C
MVESIEQNLREPVETLRAKAASLPRSPGVYSWLDVKGTVIYVGKAKDLRARVLSYFRTEGDGRLQVPQLMAHAVGLDYLVTGSEIEALIAEAAIIRARQPRYNVRLKDDKRYPFIKITNEDFPRVYVTRTVSDDGGRYLGPYTDVKALRRTIELVNSIFPLRKCRTPVAGRSRACLNHQIKKCSGPCMGYVSREDYAATVEDAYRFLTGRNEDLIKDLTRRMNEAADALQFEKASELRDLSMAVRKVNERRRAFSTHLRTGDWDVVNFTVTDTEACVVVMEIREGDIFGKKDYLLGGIQYSTSAELLSSFLLLYYSQATFIPPEIHLPVEPDDEQALIGLLSERRGGTSTFIRPQRGEKARLLAMAHLNADTILKEILEKRDRKKDQIPRTLLSLKRDLHLAQPPRTIACIDISHLHGTDTVASLVFFRDGVPEKKEYRHFKIETVQGIDDFASMREVVTRYFKRRLEENRETPDLLMVDGGKGQLSSAGEALVAVGRPDQPVIGLAKRLEEVYLPGASDPQNIPKTSSAIHLLQRIRDEAHRFAVTYQRKRRVERTISSSLNSMPGLGKKTVQVLLSRFGSVEAMRHLSEKEIAHVPGIGSKRAAVVFRNLHGEGDMNEP